MGVLTRESPQWASDVQALFDSHPLYHPRPKQGGAAPPTNEWEGGDTEDASQFYDPDRKV